MLLQFLSLAEIAECLDAGAARGRMPGDSPLSLLRDAGLGFVQPTVCDDLRLVKRDVAYSAEHVALYLHRRAYLQERCPVLWDKIVTGMRTQPGEWGSPATLLSVRCCELHTYVEGGSLLDPTHYNEGSALTLSILLRAPTAGFVILR